MPKYANVTATLGLFVALGGTATAAVTLPHDSVGSPQIRKDAVRSPEIAPDAVRSPEIAPDAVRSSELRDGGILLTDISAAAQRALSAPASVRIAEKDSAEVPVCGGTDLRACPNLVERSLGSAAPDEARNWLVQAKLVVSSPDTTARDYNNRCGLVQALNQAPSAVIDEVRLGRLPDSASTEIIALSGVVSDRFHNPLMAVRCTTQQFEEMDVENVKITAVEVGSITGP
jgi:hypothetical protein